jgi:hypothetical protein
MKIETSESFFESLERLAWYDTKLWKAWEFITRTTPRFFKNIWRFRKELGSHEWWDYTYSLEILYRSLSIMEKGMSEKGIEVAETRNVKLIKMRRALELIKHKLDNDYVDRAEEELGPMSYNPIRFEPVEGKEGLFSLVDDDTPAEKKQNLKVFRRARVIEKKEWNELWDIFKGTKLSKNWEKYDGSDMRGWWD